ncbi:sigma factor-like helix-turn-helix DNA-binding protein [Microbacterium sp. RD1]|uniref:sigma factor-like helix-turn-helix DNA-binding protein n=1 Tax=Microbacterium sp. RD1 TaxID=3457313 RepID=UPI003FA55302
MPEDLFVGTGSDSSARDTADPLDRVTIDDAVSTALLVVLESLTPAERVAFVLHDVFAVPFDEIGELVGRSTDAARQLASSARRHVRTHRTSAVSRQEHDDVVRAFRTATEGGNIADLVRTLAHGVTLRADGGGVVRVAPNAVVGPDRVARFLLGVRKKQPRMQLQERRTADGLGLAMVLDDHLFGIASFQVTHEGITDLWLVLDPGKLQEWDVS